jgi:hypothetical protein
MKAITKVSRKAVDDVVAYIHPLKYNSPNFRHSWASCFRSRSLPWKGGTCDTLRASLRMGRRLQCERFSDRIARRTSNAYPDPHYTSGGQLGPRQASGAEVFRHIGHPNICPTYDVGR